MGGFEELGSEERKGEAWEGVKPIIAEFESILGAEEGPFVLGQEGEGLFAHFLRLSLCVHRSLTRWGGKQYPTPISSSSVSCR